MCSIIVILWQEQLFKVQNIHKTELSLCVPLPLLSCLPLLIHHAKYSLTFFVKPDLGDLWQNRIHLGRFGAGWSTFCKYRKTTVSSYRLWKSEQQQMCCLDWRSILSSVLPWGPEVLCMKLTFLLWKDMHPSHNHFLPQICFTNTPNLWKFSCISYKLEIPFCPWNFAKATLFRWHFLSTYHVLCHLLGVRSKTDPKIQNLQVQQVNGVVLTRLPNLWMIDDHFSFWKRYNSRSPQYMVSSSVSLWLSLPTLMLPLESIKMTPSWQGIVYARNTLHFQTRGGNFSNISFQEQKDIFHVEIASLHIWY